jgi:hypothetical protein
MFNPKKHILITLILFCGGFLSSLSAQTLTARVQSTTVGVGQEFQIDYSINANGNNFTAPSFDGFNVSGPATSQSVSIVNGSYSQSITYSYDLVPKAEGTFTIGPASINCNGKTVTSNSLTIKVVKGAPGNSPQPNNSSPQPGNPNASAPTEVAGDNNIFIRILPSKSKVYEGEEVTATIKIYTKLSVESVQVSDAPSFSGFYSEDVTPNNKGQLAPAKEVVNGITYMTATLKQNILFPQHTGKIKIDPLTAECLVDQPVKTNNLFAQFFGGSYKRVQYNVKSEPTTVEVMPLPKTEKPFSGAVGEFTVKGELDKNKVKANDAVNLTITISGNGNLKLIDTLPIKFPPDFDRYDPKITDHFNINASGVSGTRTYNYLLVPRHPGSYKIPPIEFTYFNPKKKGYVSLSIPEMNLDVAKGDNNNSSVTVSGPVNKEDVKVLGSDIRYIHAGHETYYHTDDFFLYSFPFFAGIFVPLFAFIGFVAGRRRYVEMHKDSLAVRKRGATRMAKKRLKVAHQSIAAGNKEVFYAELLSALNGYFSDKFSIPLADLSRDTITTNLTQKNVKPETLQMANKTLDDCEFARYAPATVTGNLEEVYTSAVNLITLLEDEIS